MTATIPGGGTKVGPMARAKKRDDIDIRDPWDRLLEPYFIAFFLLVVLGMLGGLIFAIWITPWGRLCEVTGIGCLVTVGIVIFGTSLASLDWLLTYFKVRHKRMAEKPAALFAAGEEDEAKAAYRLALEQANRFASGDCRRGVMFYTLARYAANQGRRDEAEDLFAKSIRTLTEIRKDEPGAYFTALNGYAQFLIHGRRYDDSQPILESILDLAIPTARKVGSRPAQYEKMDLWQIEFLAHQSLAYLFLALNEPDLVFLHLLPMENVLPTLWQDQRDRCQGPVLVTKCLWLLLKGQPKKARAAIEAVTDRKTPFLEYAQTKLALAFGEFEDAAEHSRNHLAWARTLGPLHRPEVVDSLLDAAECKFEMGEKIEGLKRFREACEIVVDFALPTDAAWVMSVGIWLQRARDLGKEEMAVAFEAELGRASALPVQAITIFEKFRISPAE